MNFLIPWMSAETRKFLIALTASPARRIAYETPGTANDLARRILEKYERAGTNTEETLRVTFDDVGGLHQAKQSAREVVDFLQDPRKYQNLGATIPRGVLFTGLPGCGKTLLARAVMGEAGVPAFHAGGSEFVELSMGVGAVRMRDTFRMARENKPAIILIDDIDAFARRRGEAESSPGELELNQTLLQLVAEMEPRRRNAGVILLATTSRIDLLDPELLQPARFERIVRIGLPDEGERQSIFELHLKGMPLGEDVDPAVLARLTPGFSGASIRQLVNGAALLAVSREKQEIGMAEFEAVLERE